MKAGWIVAGVLAILAVLELANAQGVIGGAQQGASQGAREGSKAAGPVGGVLSAVSLVVRSVALQAA